MNDDHRDHVPDPPRSSRRRFFGLAGAAAAGLLTGRLTSHDEASAATGDPLAVGQTTVAPTKTKLSTTGPIANDGAFVVDAPNADYGVFGTAGGIGVYGKGPIGVLGQGAVGGVFSGTDTALSLTPTGTSGPSQTQSLKGDVLVDRDGVMWFCVADGTPGTWIKLSHGGVRPLASPERVYASSVALNQGENRTIPIVGASTVPAAAVGILGNLTVFNMVGGGYVTLYPAGIPRPPTSSVNWNQSAPVPGAAIANAYSVGLGSGGAVTLFADATVAPGNPATQVLLDVTAYVL